MYIADGYDFGPVTLTGEQHRGIAECIEDLDTLAPGDDAGSIVWRLVEIMLEANADSATKAR